MSPDDKQWMVNNLSKNFANDTPTWIWTQKHITKPLPQDNMIGGINVDSFFLIALEMINEYASVDPTRT